MKLKTTGKVFFLCRHNNNNKKKTEKHTKIRQLRINWEVGNKNKLKHVLEGKFKLRVEQ